jgi:hypothetical protein
MPCPLCNTVVGAIAGPSPRSNPTIRCRGQNVGTAGVGSVVGVSRKKATAESVDGWSRMEVGSRQCRRGVASFSFLAVSKDEMSEMFQSQPKHMQVAFWAGHGWAGPRRRYSITPPPLQAPPPAAQSPASARWICLPPSETRDGSEANQSNNSQPGCISTFKLRLIEC